MQADASIEDVATLLAEKDVSRLPVLDGERLVGIVSKSRHRPLADRPGP